MRGSLVEWSLNYLVRPQQHRLRGIVSPRALLAPDDPQVSDTLEWILYRRGAHKRALVFLKESAAKLPRDPQVQYHLGMVSAELGDREAARQALAIAAAAPAPFPGQDDATKDLGLTEVER